MLKRALQKQSSALHSSSVLGGVRLQGCGLKQLGGLTRGHSTVDNEEVDRFNQLSNTWWEEKSSFAALHTMNKLRIPLIKQSLPLSSEDETTPLFGNKILDVGCGGGILSEPMARLGAQVTGLDASKDGIEAALQHRDSLNEDILNRNLDYQCDTIENFVIGREESFDAVVASEVVEHVASLDTFVGSCAQLLKPGGSLIVTTINRTQLSYWLTIVAAENMLSIVEKGTHDWNKYIQPQHLQHVCQQHGCRLTLLHGMSLNILTLTWSWTQNTLMNYAAVFSKSIR